MLGMIEWGTRLCLVPKLCFLALLVLPTSETSAEGRSAPLVDVYTADGVIGSGPLEQVREDWSVSVSATKALPVSGSDLVSLRQAKSPLPPTPRGERVVFTNGDQLPGTPLELSGERIRFRARVGTEQEMALPLSAISVFWF